MLLVEMQRKLQNGWQKEEENNFVELQGRALSS